MSPDGAGPMVVLIGPMGSGKSTVGRRLAELLRQPLRDTDADIEREASKSISDIFVDDGESRFRELEQTAVLAALAAHRGVLSLGGGAVLAPVTRTALTGHRVVFLNVSMPVGVRRAGLSTNRPLLVGVNPRASYKALLDARLPIYRQVAGYEIDTDQLSAAQIARKIAADLELT